MLKLEKGIIELIDKEILNSEEMAELLDSVDIKEWDLIGNSGKHDGCNWYSIIDVNGNQYDIYEKN